MTAGLTELVFILDQSGSMYNLTEDTIGGFNSMLEKQRHVKATAKSQRFSSTTGRIQSTTASIFRQCVL